MRELLSAICHTWPEVEQYVQARELAAASSPNLRFWTIFDGRREELPFQPAVFTILSENNRRGKLLR